MAPWRPSPACVAFTHAPGSVSQYSRGMPATEIDEAIVAVLTAAAACVAWRTPPAAREPDGTLAHAGQ